MYARYTIEKEVLIISVYYCTFRFIDKVSILYIRSDRTFCSIDNHPYLSIAVQYVVTICYIQGAIWSFRLLLRIHT